MIIRSVISMHRDMLADDVVEVMPSWDEREITVTEKNFRLRTCFAGLEQKYTMELMI